MSMQFDVGYDAGREDAKKEFNADCDQLQREVTRLSGKTGFCTQCEAYAKERNQLQREVERLKTELKSSKTNHQFDLELLADDRKDRDRWRTLADELAEGLKNNHGFLMDVMPHDPRFQCKICPTLAAYDAATQKEPK